MTANAICIDCQLSVRLTYCQYLYWVGFNVSATVVRCQSMNEMFIYNPNEKIIWLIYVMRFADSDVKDLRIINEQYIMEYFIISKWFCHHHTRCPMLKTTFRLVSYQPRRPNDRKCDGKGFRIQCGQIIAENNRFSVFWRIAYMHIIWKCTWYMTIGSAPITWYLLH